MSIAAKENKALHHLGLAIEHLDSPTKEEISHGGPRNTIAFAAGKIRGTQRGARAYAVETLIEVYPTVNRKAQRQIMKAIKALTV